MARVASPAVFGKMCPHETLADDHLCRIMSTTLATLF